MLPAGTSQKECRVYVWEMVLLIVTGLMFVGIGAALVLY